MVCVTCFLPTYLQGVVTNFSPSVWPFLRNFLRSGDFLAIAYILIGMCTDNNLAKNRVNGLTLAAEYAVIAGTG